MGRPSLSCPTYCGNARHISPISLEKYDKDMTNTQSTKEKGIVEDPNTPVLNRVCDLNRATEFLLTIETNEPMEVVNKLTTLAATDAMKTFKAAHWFNKRPEIVYASSISEMRAIRLLPRERVKGKGGNAQVLHKFAEIVEGNGDFDPRKSYLHIPYGNPIDLPHPNEVNDSTPGHWRGARMIQTHIEQRDEATRLGYGDATYELPLEHKLNASGNLMRIQDSIEKFNSKTEGRGRIYVIDNAELFLTSETFIHFMKHMAYVRRNIQMTGIFVVLLVPRGFQDFPKELTECSFKAEWKLPSKKYWRRYISSTLSSYTINGEPVYPNGMSEIELERVVTALAGLTTERGIAAILLSKQKYGRIEPSLISHEKVQQIKGDNVDLRMPDNPVKLGGVQNLEDLIEVLQYASTPSARSYGAKPPALIFKAGAAGTGKTAAVDQIAYETQRPVIRVESTTTNRKYVGEDVQMMAKVFSYAQAMGAIIFFDEIEKQIRSVTNSDGGTSNAHTNGLLQLLLTRIQDIRNDDKDNTLVVMTANRIDGVAPELLRRAQGTKYYYGLPDAKGQEEIFKIHINRIKRNGGDRDWSHFEPIVKELIYGSAKRTEGMSGSTIATVVEQAIMLAGMRSDNTEEPTYEDFVTAIEGAEGESMTQEEIAKIYQECKAKGFRDVNSDDTDRETEVQDLVSADTGRAW